MEKGLLEKTGKPLSHWVKVVKNAKLEKHKAIIDFLKAEHGFTYGYANFVAHKSKGSDAASQDDSTLLADQYQGKETLKPIYEKLVKAISKFGKDITITPKKYAVSVLSRQTAAPTRVPKNIHPKTPNFLISRGLIRFEFISPVLTFLPNRLL